MKKKKWIGILAGVVIATGVIIAITVAIAYAYVKNQTWPEGVKREKIVVRLHKDARWNEKYSGDGDILLENCGGYQVDYNKETNTILYVNTEGNFVEKSMSTGEENELDMKGIEESILYDREKPIHNAKYGPKDHEISFIQDDTLYVYDLLEKKVEKVTECWNASRFDVYEWKKPEEILAIRAVEKNEVLFSVKGQEADVIARYIETFALNASGEKIYAVQSYVKPHAFGFVVRGRLLEIDIDSGENRELQDLDSKYLFIECIDNKLYYVDWDIGRKRWYQLYCLNLDSGEKKCIYKTDKLIVGVIAE